MPEPEVIARARKDKEDGKAPSTQAGEFVREEIDHVREGKHGARSVKQAIAIGLSKARRAGVDIPDKRGGSTSENGAKKSRSGTRAKSKRPSAKRARASLQALRREPTSSASRTALARQARATARKRGATARHQSPLL